MKTICMYLGTMIFVFMVFYYLIEKNDITIIIGPEERTLVSGITLAFFIFATGFVGHAVNTLEKNKIKKTEQIKNFFIYILFFSSINIVIDNVTFDSNNTFKLIAFFYCLWFIIYEGKRLGRLVISLYIHTVKEPQDRLSQAIYILTALIAIIALFK